MTTLTRWCNRCGGPATALGSHNLDGSFDPASVEVSVQEVQAAIDAHYQKGRDDPMRTRNAIAFGKHIGTRE